jgi:ketopantoate reductase
MKILFWGRGVIGTLYAWAFENAGHTVEFYVREGRKAQYGSYVNLELNLKELTLETLKPFLRWENSLPKWCHND